MEDVKGVGWAQFEIGGEWVGVFRMELTIKTECRHALVVQIDFFGCHVGMRRVEGKDQGKGEFNGLWGGNCAIVDQVLNHAAIDAPILKPEWDLAMVPIAWDEFVTIVIFEVEIGLVGKETTLTCIVKLRCSWFGFGLGRVGLGLVKGCGGEGVGGVGAKGGFETVIHVGMG